jgi:hypothetical protein
MVGGGVGGSIVVVGAGGVSDTIGIPTAAASFSNRFFF